MRQRIILPCPLRLRFWDLWVIQGMMALRVGVLMMMKNFLFGGMVEMELVAS
jgi:hypothetical protein